MEIRARLDEATLRQLLDEILPVTVLLDDDKGLEGRWVKINRPHHLDFLAGDGVRIGTSGELRWPIGPVPVTVIVQSLQLVIRPVIEGEGLGARVMFRPSLEKADLQNVPDFVDRGIVGLVNRALEARGDRLAWAYGRSLSPRFVLPDALSPLEDAGVTVQGARLHVHADALEFVATLGMHVTRVPV